MKLLKTMLVKNGVRSHAGNHIVKKIQWLGFHAAPNLAKVDFIGRFYQLNQAKQQLS